MNVTTLVIVVHWPWLITALKVTEVVPAVVGVPEITPVDVLTLSPGGNGVALYELGLGPLSTVIGYGAKATPTLPVASPLVIVRLHAGIAILLPACRISNKRMVLSAQDDLGEKRASLMEGLSAGQQILPLQPALARSLHWSY